MEIRQMGTNRVGNWTLIKTILWVFHNSQKYRGKTRRRCWMSVVRLRGQKRLQLPAHRCKDYQENTHGQDVEYQSATASQRNFNTTLIQQHWDKTGGIKSGQGERLVRFYHDSIMIQSVSVFTITCWLRKIKMDLIKSKRWIPPDLADWVPYQVQSKNVCIFQILFSC